MKNISYSLSLVLWCIVTLFLLTACRITSASVTPKIAAGGSHSIALDANGSVWTWGWNETGQLGNGTTNNKSTPIQLDSLKNIIDVSGGSYHTMALSSDGTLWAWGRNTSVGFRGHHT